MGPKASPAAAGLGEKHPPEEPSHLQGSLEQPCELQELASLQKCRRPLRWPKTSSVASFRKCAAIRSSSSTGPRAQTSARERWVSLLPTRLALCGGRRGFGGGRGDGSCGRHGFLAPGSSPVLLPSFLLCLPWGDEALEGAEDPSERRRAGTALGGKEAAQLSTQGVLWKDWEQKAPRVFFALNCLSRVQASIPLQELQMLGGAPLCP